MKYVYILTDNNRKNLHVGFCEDMKKTIQFYQDMPTLFFDPVNRIHRLVFIKEFTSEEEGMKSFKEISTYTRAQKEKLIIKSNPNWTSLSVN